MFRKLFVFSFCFSFGVLFQLPIGDNSLGESEAFVTDEAQIEPMEKPNKCLLAAHGGHESRRMKKLTRQYDSLIKRRHELIQENIEIPLITESERYVNIEWKLYELRKKIEKQLLEENNTAVYKQFCSEF